MLIPKLLTLQLQTTFLHFKINYTTRGKIEENILFLGK